MNALGNTVEAAVDTLPATTRFASYRLTHEGLPAALVVDSPGLTDTDRLDSLVQAADDCDMILWVSSAARAARQIDARALAAIRAHFAAEPSRHRPAMLLVLTHVDSLRPFNEWDPPYDLAQASRAKSRSILAAMEAAGAELGFAAEEIVPVRADIAVAPYNMDALWAKIMGLMPEAQRARLMRTLEDIKSVSAWGTVWSQALSAGRVVKGTFLTRSPTP